MTSPRLIQRDTAPPRYRPYDRMIEGFGETAALGAQEINYTRPDGFFDEAIGPTGAARGHYAAIFEEFAATDLGELTARTDEAARALGLAFAGGQAGSFRVDPFPRVIEHSEWRRITLGVKQRLLALNEFVLDVYTEQRIVDAGIVPGAVVETAEYFEPDLVGTRPPNGVFTNVAGFDLVRGGDGELRVLEDNVRSPSGLSFALATRAVCDSALSFTGGCQKLTVDESIFETLRAALLAAAPPGAGEPAIALVSDGPLSAAWYEHRRLARALGIYLFTFDQLECQRGTIYGRDDDGLLKPIDVIYRRTDLDRLRSDSGALTELGELLLDPIRDQTVSCVNAFGSGVADDKLTHAYVEAMIEFYLGEEPILSSVKTFDLTEPETLDWACRNLGDLVVKPRGGLGGAGVVIGPRATADDLDAARAVIEAAPERYVAQEFVALSTHPTIAGDHLEPRHLDLRPYAVLGGEGVEVPDACLTRVALDRGEMVVNSSRGGGAKDTWVLAA